jgi:glucose-1-phosphate thymidylyltransferase
MRAVIPVAGVGARLRPHTYTLPKVLLNVAGKPILGHILDELLKQGINKATIITGYMGKLIQEYVSKNYDMDIEYVSQKESLGLGHAIWVGNKTYDDEPMLIILGDTIFDVNLHDIMNSEHSTIGVKYVEDPRRFGVVQLTGEGFISNFVEKPETFVSNSAIVGIYYIKNPSLLKSCLNEIIEKDIRTRNEYQLTDALHMMMTRGEQFKTYPVEGWYDCGKAETLLSTNQYLLEKYPNESNASNAVIIPPVYIDPTACVSDSVIGPFATVAKGACVKNSIIKNTIISDEASVETSLLADSIIGNNAVVKGHYNCLNVGNSSEIEH